MAALFAAFFAVYAWGSCRTIYVGDSGELVAAAATLGIPHPSGYPLYVLLGKLWMLLVPLGSAACRMSLFSAACTAAACALLFRVGRELRLSPPAALLTATLAAFGPSLWGEANVQRVYGLNALMLVLATGAAFRWHGGAALPARSFAGQRGPTDAGAASRDGSLAAASPGHCPSGSGRWLLLAFFLSGLGAANHTTMALFAVALGGFALAAEPSLLRRPGRLAACGGAFALGLLPYVYLPLRSRMDPRLDWGDPETPGRLFTVVLRRDFWDRAWLSGPADLLPIAGDFLRSFAAELTWAGAVLAALGLAAGLRSRRERGRGDESARGDRAGVPESGPHPRQAPRIAASGSEAPADSSRRAPVALLLLLAVLVNVAAMALHGSRSDLFLWHRYYVPSYLMAALLAGIGAQSAMDAVAGRLARRKSAGEGRARRAPSGAVLAWGLLAIPALLLVTGFPRFDRSRYAVAEDFSRSLLASLPPGAHLAASDDNVLFVLLYLHLVEGVRPDVDLILQGVGRSELPALRFDPEREPLFFTHHPNWNLPELAVVPVGLAFEVRRAGAPPPLLSLAKTELAGEADPRVPKDHLTQNLIGHFHSMRGLTLEEGDWPRAQEEFRRAMVSAPDNDVLFYNLGLVYRRNGLLERAAEAFARSHAINPRHLASAGRVRAADRLAEVEAERDAQEAAEKALLRDPALGSLAPGSPAHHRRLALLLEARGLPLAARGHRLRALEAEARGSG